MGYGDAKKILLAKILEYFGEAREKRIELQKDLSYVKSVLKKGAERAQKEATKMMAEVRAKTGLSLKN
jgi:tryptophanyl-tRNA synthetase